MESRLKWGDGSVVRDYIYIDDVVNALELAATHQGSERIFNIGTGNGKSLNEIALLIKQVMVREIDIRYFDGRKVDAPCSVLNIELAKAKLGWKPQIDFLNGLEQTIAWLSSKD